MSSTYQHACRLGAGAILTDGTNRFRVSDWSLGTGKVYGWRLANNSECGAYLELPLDLAADAPDLGDLPCGGMS